MAADQCAEPDHPVPVAASTAAPGGARLAWQCRRGMLELDLILQDFLDRYYPTAEDVEQRAFESMLTYPDALLLEFVMGHMVPSDPIVARVVARLRAPF